MASTGSGYHLVRYIPLLLRIGGDFSLLFVSKVKLPIVSLHRIFAPVSETSTYFLYQGSISSFSVEDLYYLPKLDSAFHYSDNIKPYSDFIHFSWFPPTS